MAAGLERLAAAAQVGQRLGEDRLPGHGRGQRLLASRGYAAAGTKAPFDILGDTLRGTKGVIVDMFRLPRQGARGLRAPGAGRRRLAPQAAGRSLPTPVVFIPLHKGADGFMSDEQFQTFYWPTLRTMLLGLIEEGMIPFLFAEGRYNTRLEAIMDLPKGTTIWLFDQTDMARAKETIGKVACIQGNMPLSLLHAGTAEAGGRPHPQAHRRRGRRAAASSWTSARSPTRARTRTSR